jgi:hypothetical protein
MQDFAAREGTRRSMTASTFDNYVALTKRERDLSDLRRQLHAAIDGGSPTELMLRRERDVSAERRTLHRQIDALRAELWPAAQPAAHRKQRSWLLGLTSRLT